MVEMDLDTTLASIGFGWGQVVITIVCFVLSMYTVTEAYVVGYLLVLTHCEFKSSKLQKTILANSLVSGMVISGFFLGPLADKYGRKYIIRLALIAALFCSFIASLMPEIYSLSVIRFLVGLFLNAPASLTIGYLMEFYAPKWRPLGVSIQSQGIALGLLYIPTMGWAVLPTHYSWEVSSTFEFRTWRMFLWIDALPGWLGLLGLSFVPESPYFLILAKREKEATEVLRWLCRLKRKNWDDLNITLVDPWPDRNVARSWKQFFVAVAMLFKRPVLRPFLASVFFIFGIFFNSIGMGLWYPLLRNIEDQSSMTFCRVIQNLPQFQEQPQTTETCVNTTEDDTPHCDGEVHNFMDPIIQGLGYVVFFVVITILVLWLSRRYVMAIHVGTACLLGIALNFITQPAGVLITFTLVLVIPGVLIGLASSALADCVPVELRGSALCMVRSISRLGAVCGSTLVGLLMTVSCTLTLNIFVFYLAVCVGLAFLLPKDI